MIVLHLKHRSTFWFKRYDILYVFTVKILNIYNSTIKALVHPLSTCVKSKNAYVHISFEHILLRFLSGMLQDHNIV